MRPLCGDGDLVVVAHTPSPEQLAVDGIADEGVGEGIAVTDLLTDPAQQAGLHGPIEGIEPLAGRQLGGLRHDPRLELRSSHCRRLQQVDHVLGQPGDASRHELADGLGWVEVGWHRGVAIAPRLVLAVPQLAQHLVEEEWIAVGEPA